MSRLLCCLFLLLLTAACADRQAPGPNLRGRWNGVERTFTAYEDDGRVSYTRHNVYQPDEQYMVFERSTCEEHYTENGTPDFASYAYDYRGDTLYLRTINAIALVVPNPKVAVLEHTSTTLRLLHKFRLGPGMNYVSDITYTR